MKYNAKIINSKVQIFLGAGASKCLGKWLMIEFIDNFFPQLDKDERKISLDEIKQKVDNIEKIAEESQKQPKKESIRW